VRLCAFCVYSVLVKTRERVRVLSRLFILSFQSLLRHNSNASCTVMRLLDHHLLHGRSERICWFHGLLRLIISVLILCLNYGHRSLLCMLKSYKFIGEVVFITFYLRSHILTVELFCLFCPFLTFLSVYSAL